MKRIATIGFFDGVHRGHQFLFCRLRDMGGKLGYSPLIVTFDSHPLMTLQGIADAPPLLSTNTERETLLLEQGPLTILRFQDIQSMTAEQFMLFLKERYNVHAILMGYDHHFGADRLRTHAEYKQVGERIGVAIYTANEYYEGEFHVSSSEIRREIEKGNIVLANELLGYPYALRGLVEHGNGIGHQIGFPTANIRPLDTQKMIPKSGVYECTIEVLDAYADVEGEKPHTDLPPVMTAVLNIGINPTIGNEEETIEVHIPSFEGNLYDELVEIRFVRFLREEKKFNTLEALREQISEDVGSILHQV